MSNSDGDAFKAIVHYQECLEKYARRKDEGKMLYCITKLWKLPVTIDHLTKTGVGRTVNSLRKAGGDVGERSKALVAKWKEMVAREEDEEEREQNEVESNLENKTDDAEEAEEEEEESISIEEIKPQSTSNSRENERRSRHDSKEHSSKKANRDKEEHSKQNKKQKDAHKDTDRDTNKHKSKKEVDLSDSRENKHKHKSSKRKHENDNDNEKHSKSSKKSHKNESDSDDDKRKRMKRKHEEDNKVSKRKHTVSENNHKHKIKTDKKHHKSHKRKYDSDLEDEQDDDEEEEEDMQDDSSDESKIEEKEVRKHSSKSHNVHKEDKHNKSKDKDKKDRNHDTKSSSSSSRDKDKTKHLNKDKAKLDKDNTKSKHSSKHNSSREKDQSSKKHSSPSTKSNVPVTQEGIGSGSGTSFAEALGMLEPSSSKGNKKKVAVIPPLLANNDDSSDISSPEQSTPEATLLTTKPLEPLNINIASLLPEITPNYKPMGYSVLDGGLGRNKINMEDETLSAIMYNKISRTKVYSGNKVAWGKVSSLFDLCTRVLQDNIDALEFTGGVPFSILKPVLERANYNQLFMLEQYNPYLMEDTDELWKLHCQRDFRNRSREEMETWRDMYQRCLDERESKLRALTANIKHSQDKSIPVRQTKLAYVDSVVKPPRNIARKQAKHGTGGDATSPTKKPAITPSSRLATLATAGAAGDISVPNPGSRAASTTSGSSNVVVKPKKAPLMQKTLALMKNRFRR